MSWNDIGYTENLIREDFEVEQDQQIDPLAFEQNTPDFSGSKLTGLIQSQNGKLQMNLDENYFFVTDGVQERARLGKLEDGTYGILIKNQEGKELLKFGDKNIIKSPDDSLELNFDETQLIVRNEGGTPLVLLGKLQ